MNFIERFHASMGGPPAGGFVTIGWLLNQHLGVQEYEHHACYIVQADRIVKVQNDTRPSAEPRWRIRED